MSLLFMTTVSYFEIWQLERSQVYNTFVQQQCFEKALQRLAKSRLKIQKGEKQITLRN